MLQPLPQQHIKALDGLRGMAITLVLLYHCYGYLFHFGWMGVDLFFVLSGFLITNILLKTKFKPKYFRNFWARRILRIFPLYYFSLFIILFLLPPLLSKFDFSYYHQHQLWFWAYLQNWLYSLEGWPKNHLLHHFWSLAVEEQFYLFFPLCVYAFRKKTLLLFCGIMIVSSIVLRYWGASIGFVSPFEYVLTIARMDALLLGAATAILMNMDKGRQYLARYTLPVGALSVVYLLVIFALTKNWFIYNPYFAKLGYTIIDVFFVCCLVVALMPKNTFVKRFLEHKYLCWMGKYSYGLYVYHFPIYCISRVYLLPELTKMLPMPVFFVKLVNAVLVTIATIVISYYSYHLLEKHFLKLKRYFT